MSWFSSHYDKVFLGAGVLIALLALYFGWSQLQSSLNDFDDQLPITGKDNSGVDGAEKISRASQSMMLESGWKDGKFEDREVDLFTGIPLFIKRDSDGKAVDLYKDEPVHPPIENDFWLTYRLDPGYADSPHRDPDGDGFSNLEEFRAKTDPTNRENHPPLINKLTYVRDDTLVWLLKPGAVNQEGAVAIKYEDSNRRRNNAGVSNPVELGEVFFAEGAAQGRFKYLDHVTREQKNLGTGIVEQITFVRIEDQKFNKTGEVYEVPAPLRGNRGNQHIQYDRSAILVLKALGEGGKEMVVEEKTHFSLPGGKEEKRYLLKSVTPEKVVVEYLNDDAETTVVEIPKGAFPSRK